MDNYFKNTLANLCFTAIIDNQAENEDLFISDLFNEQISDVGHIQFIPPQNRLCINVGLNDGEIKTYSIYEPRIEFLRFIFNNSNPKVKKAIQFYFKNSSNSQKQQNEKRYSNEADEN